MNEQELAKKIVQHLDFGVENLKQGTAYRLQAARHAALERYRIAPEPVLGLAWAGEVRSRLGHSRYFSARYLFALALLVLSLLAVGYWQITLQANDIAEIDAALLSGDLPINAYLDSEFEAWLKRSGH